MKKAVEKETKTAKCPDCGGNYIKQTGYCPSCKKKVKESTQYNVFVFRNGVWSQINKIPVDKDEAYELERSAYRLPNVDKNDVISLRTDQSPYNYIYDYERLKENTAEESTMETIKVTKEVQINENTILEPGDRVQVIKENYNYYYKEIATNSPVDEYGVTMKIGSSKHIPLNRESLQALNDFFEREMA